MISRRKLIRSLIALVILVFLINFTVFISLSTRPTGGKGVLNYNDTSENWSVDFNDSLVHGYSYIIIQNPQSFPHILVSENIGMEVFYVYEIPEYITMDSNPRIWNFIYLVDYKVFITYFIITLASIPMFIALLTIFYLLSKRMSFS